MSDAPQVPAPGGFKRVESIVENVFAFPATVLVLVSAVLACLEVISRYVFGTPHEWTDTFVRIIALCGIYVASAAAFKEGRHTSMDIVPILLKGRPRQLLGVFNSLASLVCCLLLFWAGIQQVQWLRSIHMAFEPMAIRIPYWLVFLMVPIGFGGCAIFAARRLAHSLRLLVSNVEEAHGAGAH